MHRFDWKVLESRHVIKNRCLSLRADRCEMPNGPILPACYVFEYSPWVNVVALTADEKVVLVRQYRHGLRRTLLELPGGVVEPTDASPVAAIKRELREETGYTGSTFVETGVVSPNPSNNNNLVHCFLATEVELAGSPCPDDTEQIEVIVMPLLEVIERLVNGDFIQSLHVSSLFLAFHNLGKILLTS